MTAKELRQAAERIVVATDAYAAWGMAPGVSDEVVSMARHILSTVRDDDDDPVTYENLCSIKKPYMENRKIWWNFDGFTVRCKVPL